MLPFSAHARFFSSLEQVEERLASEVSSPTKTPKPQASSSIDPSGSPIFLAYPQSDLRDSDSGPARDFLSSSSDDDKGEDHADQQEQECDNGDEDDEIEHLMSLLDVTAGEEAGEPAESCGECEFYAKVAGVRGPKCEKEKRRLEGWVEYFYRGWRDGCRREPARLAHLLLAKASCSVDGCGGIGFPETVAEFLEHDPVLATAAPAGKEERLQQDTKGKDPDVTIARLGPNRKKVVRNLLDPLKDATKPRISQGTRASTVATIRFNKGMDHETSKNGRPPNDCIVIQSRRQTTILLLF